MGCVGPDRYIFVNKNSSETDFLPMGQSFVLFLGVLKHSVLPMG